MHTNNSKGKLHTQLFIYTYGNWARRKRKLKYLLTISYSTLFVLKTNIGPKISTQALLLSHERSTWTGIYVEIHGGGQLNRGEELSAISM